MSIENSLAGVPAGQVSRRMEALPQPQAPSRSTEMVVLIVENDPKEREVLSAFLKERGHETVTAESTRAGAALLRKAHTGVVLLGLNGEVAQAMEFLELSQAGPAPPSVILMTPKPRLEDAVRAMKQGAYDFWGKPVILERLQKTLELLDQQSYKPREHEEASAAFEIITQDPAMLRIKAMAKRVAASSATVFIQGESGTGKELFARYIHRESGRKTRPFVALNCAALPETLLESELFGHEKGAFTGAIKSKEGKFELAHGGTLLLDEVTEIPFHLQAKLLRVLQENEVDRVGGKHPIPIDVRVIATTNLFMDEALREGRFRKDLYYRLNVIPLKIPPLRERPQDVAGMAAHFIRKYGALHGTPTVELDPSASRLLQQHSWPGNVRELQNVIQRAVLLSQERKLTPEHLIFDEEGSAPGSGELTLMPIEEMEKRMIQKALATVDGNRTRAAEILGISVRTLRNKLQEYRQEQGSF